MIRPPRALPWHRRAILFALIGGALFWAGCDEGAGQIPASWGKVKRPDDAALGRPFGNPPPSSARAKKAREASEKKGVPQPANPRL